MISSSWSMPFCSFNQRVSMQPRGLPVLLIHGYGCNSGYWHAMSDGPAGQSAADAKAAYDAYVTDSINSCTRNGLARALHAVQDSAARGHNGFQSWAGGMPSVSHVNGDAFPTHAEQNAAVQRSREVLDRFHAKCECVNP